MNRLMACLVALSLVLSNAARAQDDSTALPIQIEIDLDGIHAINSHRSLDTLEAQLKSILVKRIKRKLFKHWYVAEGAGISRLVLTIEQAGPKLNFLIDLEFRGDDRKMITYAGRAPTTLPMQQPTFDAELVNALFEFLGKKDDDIEGASTWVHAETDDGLKTVLQLERPLDRESAAYYYEHKLNLTWDHVGSPITVEAQRGERMFTHMLLNADETRSGTISPDVKKSRPGELPVARFCVHRPLNEDPPAGTKPVVMFDCPLEGPCALRDAVPESWADDNCTIPIRFEQESPRWSWGMAHAAAPDPENWSVPDLDVLFDRVKDNPGRFVGFTEFTLNASDLSGLEADAFTVRLIANGVPILIDGLKPEVREFPFDPSYGLYFRFGLENLKFAGREDGCEDLSVAFQFSKDGEPGGSEVILTRGYAALRHAPRRSYVTRYGTFTWDGQYIAPSERNESGIFLASARYALGDASDERQALEALNRMRVQLDSFGWTIRASELSLGLGLESVLDGKENDAQLTIVGKIRPPRTIFPNGDAAYGLLVGVEEPSGQLQFTFDRTQIRALQGFLNARRDESSVARSIIEEEERRTVFSYNEPRRVAPEWVCQNK